MSESARCVPQDSCLIFMWQAAGGVVGFGGVGGAKLVENGALETL